jgi:hypothetical protein
MSKELIETVGVTGIGTEAPPPPPPPPHPKSSSAEKR